MYVVECFVLWYLVCDVGVFGCLLECLFYDVVIVDGCFCYVEYDEFERSGYGVFFIVVYLKVVVRLFLVRFRFVVILMLVVVVSMSMLLLLCLIRNFCGFLV